MNLETNFAASPADPCGDTIRGLWASCLQDMNLAPELVVQALADTPAPAGACIVSVLGASGPTLRLVCTIQATPAFLSAVYPMPLPAEDAARLEDWSRELNNQLLGRLKNQLLARGCELLLGVPTVVTGASLQISASPSLQVHWLQAAIPQGWMTLSLAMEALPGLVLNEMASNADSEPVLEEGALALF